MRSDASLQRTRGTRAVLASSIAIGIATLACAVASCAESDNATAAPQPEGSKVPELDATSDAAPDADCLDAGDGGGCGPRALSCAEADFCEVATGVDARYTLLDVWGSSKSDVWAVGSGGTIIHWDGAAWTRVPLAVHDTLRGVGGSSASDVWIVSSVSLVLHSTGFGTAAGFTRQPLIERTDGTTGRGAVSKVWAANSGALFVGGHTAFPWVQGDSLWRFHSDFDADAGIPAWEPVSTYSEVPPYLGVEGLWGTSASDIWVVGEVGLVRRSKGPVGDGGGEQWSTMETTLTTEKSSMASGAAATRTCGLSATTGRSVTGPATARNTGPPSPPPRRKTCERCGERARATRGR